MKKDKNKDISPIIYRTLRIISGDDIVDFNVGDPFFNGCIANNMLIVDHIDENFIHLQRRNCEEIIYYFTHLGFINKFPGLIDDNYSIKLISYNDLEIK